MNELLSVVGYMEALAGAPVACRRGQPLDPRQCRPCPAWSTCRGLGVRYPGLLGADGTQNDPVREFRAKWLDQFKQINEMKEKQS